MKKIPLTKGMFAIVDDEDYPRLNSHKWTAQKGGLSYYAQRSVRQGGRRHTVIMHREVLCLVRGDGKQVDHIDHNGLNNCRCNIRVCTRSENQQNRRVTGNSSSKYKGVFLMKHLKKKPWMAVAQKGSNKCYLGCYKKEIDAARAYDLKAKELFGEFACLNFPEEVALSV